MAMTRSLRENAKAVITDVTNKAFRHHSGACDVIIVRHKYGELRSSLWHVHLGRDVPLQPAKAQLRLELAGASTGLVMRVSDEKKAFFPGGDGESTNPLRPSREQLEAIPLKSGHNEGMFRVEEDVDGACCVKGHIPVGVFLWDVSDRVVVADIEGVVLKTDLWSRTDLAMRTSKEREESAVGVEHVREGVGQLLSYLDHAGYRILLLKAAVRFASILLASAISACLCVCARARVPVPVHVCMRERESARACAIRQGLDMCARVPCGRQTDRRTQ